MLQTSKFQPSNILQILDWYQSMGVDETICEEPKNRFTETNNCAENKTKRFKETILTTPVGQSLVSAQEQADKAKTLQDLKKIIKNIDGISLKKTSHTTVFGDGNPKSNLMIITDSPNQDEDRDGLPFVGEVGDLFNKMFGAINKKRETDFYIASLIPWRILGNRKPNEQEIALFIPFLKKHIELVSPKIIVSLGNTVSQTLLASNEGMNKLRGRWQKITISGKSIDVIPTFHPSYLLKQPNAKKNQ